VHLSDCVAHMDGWVPLSVLMQVGSADGWCRCCGRARWVMFEARWVAFRRCRGVQANRAGGNLVLLRWSERSVLFMMRARDALLVACPWSCLCKHVLVARTCALFNEPNGEGKGIGTVVLHRSLLELQSIVSGVPVRKALTGSGASLVLQARLMRHWLKEFWPELWGDVLGATVHARRKLREEAFQQQLDVSMPPLQSAQGGIQSPFVRETPTRSGFSFLNLTPPTSLFRCDSTPLLSLI
jgi:hypothetical protein